MLNCGLYGAGVSLLVLHRALSVPFLYKCTLSLEYVAAITLRIHVYPFDTRVFTYIGTRSSVNLELIGHESF